MGGPVPLIAPPGGRLPEHPLKTENNCFKPRLSAGKEEAVLFKLTYGGVWGVIRRWRMRMCIAIETRRMTRRREDVYRHRNEKDEGDN